MTTTNDITGDTLVSKAANNAYRNNWDAIFGPKQEPRWVVIEKDNCQVCGYGVDDHEFGAPRFQCLYPPLPKVGDEMSNRVVQDEETLYDGVAKGRIRYGQ
jgi:hypothetical protein